MVDETPQRTPPTPPAAARPHRRRITRTTMLWIAALLVVAALLAWWRWPSPIPVDTARVTRGTLTVSLDENAYIDVRRHTVLAAPITGRILENAHRAGDAVVRGQTIAVMVAAPLDPRMSAQDFAHVQAADALVAEARAQVTTAQLALDEARRARVRADALLATGAIAQHDHELAVTLEATRAQALEATRQRLAAAISDARGARAALLGAQPTDPAPGTQVALRAPIAGQILRMYEEHDRIVPAGTPLIDVGDLSDIEVVAEVLSTDVTTIRPGAIMWVRVNDTTAAVRARVVTIEPAAFKKLSPLGVEEQRVNVRAVPIDRFPPVGDAYEVDASIVQWEGRDVLHMPISALIAEGAGWAVYRIEGNRARKTAVTIGHRSAQAAEIRAGLASGDRVVLYPNDRITDGVRVCEGQACR